MILTIIGYVILLIILGTFFDFDYYDKVWENKKFSTCATFSLIMGLLPLAYPILYFNLADATWSFKLASSRWSYFAIFVILACIKLIFSVFIYTIRCENCNHIYCLVIDEVKQIDKGVYHKVDHYAAHYETDVMTTTSTSNTTGSISSKAVGDMFANTASTNATTTRTTETKIRRFVPAYDVDHGYYRRTTTAEHCHCKCCGRKFSEYVEKESFVHK